MPLRAWPWKYLVVVQDCPVYADVAPFIQCCLNPVVGERSLLVNSIFRGKAAEPILNKYGKHSQAQLYAIWLRRAPGALPANPPGFSTHELRSDGVAYPSVPRGGRLEWWMQGFDVNDAEVDRVMANARRFGWTLFRPYSSGTEFHHLNFRNRPQAPRWGSKLQRRFRHIRMSYPTS